MTSTRWVHCEECGGEGRIYWGNDPKDRGPCPAACLAGEIEVLPIAEEDLPAHG
jgi:hypothetical protein